MDRKEPSSAPRSDEALRHDHAVAMVVRPRLDADLDALVGLAQAVHELDGYPRYLSGPLRDFIASPEAMAAWVAEVESEVVGHVALHPQSSRDTTAFAMSVTGLDSEHLVFVARLLVAPRARGRGLGQALLATAARDAVQRRLRPLLDVGTDHGPAIALYERCGWVRIGTLRVRFGHGGALDEHVYLLPDDLPRRVDGWDQTTLPEATNGGEAAR